MAKNPITGSLWQKHSTFDEEDIAIRIMNSVEQATKNPDSVQSLGSFAQFADDSPKPNDDPENENKFKP